MHGVNRPPFIAELSEDAIQRAVVQHLDMRGVPGLVFFHPANGGKRNRIEAARFKGLGVRAGVADLILIHRSHVYALELKSAKGRPSAAQMQWIQCFNSAGGRGVICNGLDETLQTLTTWGLIR